MFSGVSDAISESNEYRTLYAYGGTWGPFDFSSPAGSSSTYFRNYIGRGSASGTKLQDYKFEVLKGFSTL